MDPGTRWCASNASCSVASECATWSPTWCSTTHRATSQPSSLRGAPSRSRTRACARCRRVGYSLTRLKASDMYIHVCSPLSELRARRRVLRLLLAHLVPTRRSSERRASVDARRASTPRVVVVVVVVALFLLYFVDALSLVRCAPAASTPLVGSPVGLPVGRITIPASRGLGVAARRAGPPHALGRAVPPTHDPPRRRTPGEIERVVGEETNRSPPFPPLFVLGFTRPPARHSPPSADIIRATPLP